MIVAESTVDKGRMQVWGLVELPRPVMDDSDIV
jgi:hypothetical protein